MDNQHFIFPPEIGLVSCWEGLLRRKCQLISSIVTERPGWTADQQPTAGLENEHFQSKIFSQLTRGLPDLVNKVRQIDWPWQWSGVEVS